MVKILTDKLIAVFIFIGSAFTKFSFFYIAIVYTITPSILFITNDSIKFRLFFFLSRFVFYVLLAHPHDVARVHVGETPV